MGTFSHSMLSTDHLPKNVVYRKRVEKEARHTLSDIDLFEQKVSGKKNRYPVIALKAHLQLNSGYNSKNINQYIS